ncbi:MAG: peptidoglycan-binding protein, partial [Minwuiales bacterium]|nr:peptidoglycan-binding protein [Minwuiales bacterium]
IPPHRVLGHSDVAPSRKQDPGELFDWARLASAGIGLWPDADFDVSPNAPHLGPGSQGGAVTELQIALGRFGYDVQGTGVFDPGTAAAVTAFQRHFRPSRVDGMADGETASLLLHLVGRMP